VVLKKVRDGFVEETGVARCRQPDSRGVVSEAVRDRSDGIHAKHIRKITRSNSRLKSA